MRRLLSARHRRGIPRRSLWRASSAFLVSESVDAFLSLSQQQSASDPDWFLDFGELERMAQTSQRWAASDASHLLKRLAATLKESTARPRSLRVELTSKVAVEAFTAMCRDSPRWAAALNSVSASMGGDGAQFAPLLEALTPPGGAEVSQLRSLDLGMAETSGEAIDDAFHVEAGCTRLTTLLRQLPKLRCLTLRYLDCDGCPARTLQQLAEAISRFMSQLETLELHGMPHLAQSLTRAEALAHCPQLQHLALPGALLGDVWGPAVLAQLHRSLGGWGQLCRLDLRQCALTTYGIERLHGTMGVTTMEARVRELLLSHNTLDDDSTFYLGCCLLRCVHLEVLELRHCQLSARSAEQLLSSLSNAKLLRRLQLQSNGFGDPGAMALQSYAGCLPALADLDLSRCHLTVEGLGNMAAAMASWPHLSQLRLADNDFRAASPRCRPPAVAEEAPEPRLAIHDRSYMAVRGSNEKVPTSYELDRRDREEGRVRHRWVTPSCPSPPTVTAPLYKPDWALGEALSRCPELRVLDLSNTSLCDGGVLEAWAVARGGGKQLEQLHLSGCPLLHTPSSHTALVDILRASPRLRVLAISFTACGDAGIVSLCDAGDGPGVLCGLTELVDLRLSACSVGTLGMEALREAVCHLPSLQALYVDGNHSSQEGLEALLDAVADLPRMPHVRVQWQGGRLSSAGANRLRAAHALS